jgi:hypothetical protein
VPPGATHRVGHEERDIRFGPIVWASIGLFVLSGVVLIAMRLLFVVLDIHRAEQSPPANPLAAEAGESLPPAPRLQTHPIKDLTELRAAEDSILDSYGWVDVQAGIVRIPIARAMELLAQHPPASQAAPGDQR